MSGPVGWEPASAMINAFLHDVEHAIDHRQPPDVIAEHWQSLCACMDDLDHESEQVETWWNVLQTADQPVEVLRTVAEYPPRPLPVPGDLETWRPAGPRQAARALMHGLRPQTPEETQE